jgi:hypothetical protein
MICFGSQPESLMPKNPKSSKPQHRSGKFTKPTAKPLPRKRDRLPVPSKEVVEAIKMLAAQNRIPQRWIDATDNPTLPESNHEA